MQIPNETNKEEQAMTLSDFSKLSDIGAEKRQVSFLGHNLGNHTLLVALKLHEFYEMSAIANNAAVGEIAQRQLDTKHARALAIYILKGLVTSAIKRGDMSAEAKEALEIIQDHIGTQVYMCLQPIVANLRIGEGRSAPKIVPIIENKTETKIAAGVMLRTDDLLWVIDGQHRREAMHEVFEFLSSIQKTRRYPKKSLYEADDPDVSVPEMQAWEVCLREARSYCTVMVEVHFGLNPAQERQLFYDLNSKVKPVQASQAFDFDTANPIIAFVKNELPLMGLRLNTDEDKVDFDAEDGGLFSIKETVAVCAHLFLNKTNVKGVTQAVFNERLELAKDFWRAVIKIPGFGDKKAKHLTVAAQPVVLKALAKLVFDFSEFGRASDPKALALLLKSIPSGIDFTHNNPIWRYYKMSETDRQAHGLADLANYLPTSGGNRDVGGFENGEMRFGAKHNDIFPLIGDMIRWRLGLPNRHSA